MAHSRRPRPRVLTAAFSTPGIQAESMMKSGALVPDATILRLILSELTSRGWLEPESAHPATLHASSISSPPDRSDDCSPSSSSPIGSGDPFAMPHPSTQRYRYSESPSSSFILDGFPRTAPQAAQLADLLPINMVIHIHTPTEIILDRICNRWVHAPTGRVYNTTFNAPKVDGKDDLTGEPLTRRPDDEPEVWRSRLAKFEATTGPLLDFYGKLGLLWRVDGNSSDEISPKIFEEFGRRFA